MIVESVTTETTICHACKPLSGIAPQQTCAVLHLHESDSGQHVYNIRVNLRLALCAACLERMRGAL